MFTCAATRAIHLELVNDLNISSFLLAFRRFCGRCGLPATLLSDNAKTFKSAAKEVCSILQSREVLVYLSNNRITWTFIVERAPWWGGFWERLIQSVKKCLRKSVGRSTLSFDQLNTLLVEIEAIINSRPLMYVYPDSEGVSYALSPSHLIHGRCLTTTPNSEHYEVVSTHNSLVHRNKQQKHLRNQFLCLWRKTYLLSLREHHSITKRQNKNSVVAVGDVIVLKMILLRDTFGS